MSGRMAQKAAPYFSRFAVPAAGGAAGAVAGSSLIGAMPGSSDLSPRRAVYLAGRKVQAPPAEVGAQGVQGHRRRLQPLRPVANRVGPAQRTAPDPDVTRIPVGGEHTVSTDQGKHTCSVERPVRSSFDSRPSAGILDSSCGRLRVCSGRGRRGALRRGPHGLCRVRSDLASARGGRLRTGGGAAGCRVGGDSRPLRSPKGQRSN